MEKKNAIIDALNEARAAELLAIHQYMTQHYAIDNQDYGPLAAKIKLIAVDEMRHAEMFAERISILGGVPVSEEDAKAKKGQKVAEAMAFDVGLEDKTIANYNKYMELCLAQRDSVSAKLFEVIIAEEQIHLTYFQNVLGHIKELGPAYLATISGPAPATVPVKGFVASLGIVA